MNPEIIFITGNSGKFAEIQGIVPEIVQLTIDLPEVQSLDPQEIIIAKMNAAEEYHEGSYIVEDTSLVFTELKRLPGPFIKWFEKELGIPGLAELALKLESQKATAVVWIGYTSAPGDHLFFEGRTEGSIVRPRGSNDFGWGPIFLPDGANKTFGEMTPEEKSLYNPRIKAANKLLEFLRS